jgi:hypothetical protein
MPLQLGKRSAISIVAASTALVIVVGLLIDATGATYAAQREAFGDNAGRRDATLTYYAFHIAKLDAHVSLCDDARTNYRVGFKDVVDNSGTGVPADIVKAYDTRYENFVAGLGDVECIEAELAHYRSRATRQIMNLKRDLKALE